MASVVKEKLGYAEIEARKRRERLLHLKRKARGELDADEKEKEEQQENKEDDVAEPVTENLPEETNKKQQLDELDLSNLAPRKIDWDLKRGIAKSLEILQDRTNEVITEIVRERLDENEDLHRRKYTDFRINKQVPRASTTPKMASKAFRILKTE